MGSHRARARLGASTIALAMLAAAAPLAAQGNIRELDCRGNTGMVLRVEQDPSPRDTGAVTMVFEYRRATSATGGDPRTLDPGTCTWNPLGLADFPVEPGRVRFDVQREAQPWSATETRIMDTTVRAAVFYPDPITLPRYLLDSRHYWKFYVDDETGFSPSSQALFEEGTPTYVNITGPVRLANDVQRDLLCRGGATGLLWGGGASAGDNLAKVQLSYRVSPNVPGKSGGGLATGSCAWTDRTAMPPEPGKIWFITASNAQLRQTQSGTTVDRTPTAAERYPDMRSIPEYLKDPAHYWTFRVASRDPDSALTHGVWKADYATIVAGGLRDPGTSTVRSQPTTGTASEPYSPGAASTTSQVVSIFDIRNVVVTPGLEGVAIKFEAAANSNPTVTITPAGGGASIPLVVGSSAGSTAGMMRYSAASTTKLPRNTQFDYVISAPAAANAPLNATTASFKTLGQRVTVAFTEINLISDGDAGGNGELMFVIEPCPRYLLKHLQLGQTIRAPLDWGDGPHRIDEKMTSYADTVPDRFRVLVLGEEDDTNEGVYQGAPTYSPNWTSFCVGSGPEPGRSRDFEWNSLMLDFDLTRYPGAQGGEQFYRRAKALRNGSTLMFEVRGYIQVTRQ